MAAFPWICRRCSLQLSSRRYGGASIRRTSQATEGWRSQQTSATAIDHRDEINWAAWFNAAAPYEHASSSASSHDRGHRSYHARIWRPPVRLRSSFAPQMEAFEQRPPTLHTARDPPSTPSLISIPPLKSGSRLRDTAWVLEALEYPTWNDYPWAPEELFSTHTTYGAFVDAFELVKPQQVSVHHHFKPVRSQHGSEEDYWMHHLLANFNDRSREPIRIIGESTDKREAGISSYMQLLAQLHVNNLLYEPDNASQLKALCTVAQNEGKDWTTKLHVYNLAAFFGSVPTYDIRRLDEKYDVWHVTVSIEAFDGMVISGQGKAPFLQDADLHACAHLKMRAETLPNMDDGEGIDLRSSEHVNLDNATVLLKWFAAREPTAKLDLRTRTEALPDGSIAWSVYYTLNGEPLTDSISLPSKEKAKALADLVTAVSLVREDPSLIDDFVKAKEQANGLRLPIREPFDASNLDTLEPLVEPVLEAFRRSRIFDPDQDLEATQHLELTQSWDPGTLMGHFRQRQEAHLGRVSRETRSENLRLSQEYYQYNPGLDDVKKDRLALPAMQNRRQLLDMINGNPYSVVIGATASGKSTQIPQILLEDAIGRGQGASCNVLCTQPRRIATQALARRVCEERDEILGEVVGFQVSGEYVVSQLDGSITYCTPELLTVQVELDEDTLLDGVSHILIDEAHERAHQTDRAITTLKSVIDRRRATGRHAPKLVIMSATLHAKEFQDYLSITSQDGSVSPAPIFSIPGRLHPVEELHLEEMLDALESTLTAAERNFVMTDERTRIYLAREVASRPRGTSPEVHSDTPKSVPAIRWPSRLEITDQEEGPSPRLTAAAIYHALRSRPDGDILVFLCGYYAISAVERELNQLSQTFPATAPEHEILVLHSMESQSVDAALSPPENGTRRVFLATDIAETSLTFSLVNQVIDTGRRRSTAKHPVFGVDCLPEIWISRANSTQRAGRAGRVSAGTYYALFSNERYQDLLSTTPTRSTSPVELMRTSLRALKKYPDRDLAEYLKTGINAPNDLEITETIAFLQYLGAVTTNGKLSDLGSLLSSIPLHGRSSLLIPLGMMFSCLEPLLLIAVSLGENQLFKRGSDKHSTRRAQTMRLFYARGTYSDHIATLNAYRELRQVRQDTGDERAAQWAANSFLDYSRFESIDRQMNSLRALLFNLGVTSSEPPGAYNDRADDNNLILALATAALYPNIAIQQDRMLYTGPIGINCVPSNYSNVKLQYAATHGSRVDPDSFKSGLIGFSGYQHFGRDHATILGASYVSPLGVLLFGGQHVELKPETPNILVMDGWLTVDVGSASTAQTILRLKEAWTIVWRNAVGEYTRGRRPGISGVRDRRVRDEFVQGVVDLLALEKDGVMTVAESLPDSQESLDKLVGSRTSQTFAEVAAARPLDAFDEVHDSDTGWAVYGRADPNETPYTPATDRTSPLIEQHQGSIVAVTNLETTKTSANDPHSGETGALGRPEHEKLPEAMQEGDGEKRDGEWGRDLPHEA